MLQVTITAKGQSRDDLEDAIAEAVKRFKDGNVLGFDKNESSSFHFDVTEER
jgi:hypothetical protein